MVIFSLHISACSINLRKDKIFKVSYIVEQWRAEGLLSGWCTRRRPPTGLIEDI